MQKTIEGDEKVKSKSLCFEDIEICIRLGCYPSSISTKDIGSKPNFRGAAKK